MHACSSRHLCFHELFGYCQKEAKVARNHFYPESKLHTSRNCSLPGPFSAKAFSSLTAVIFLLLLTELILSFSRSFAGSSRKQCLLHHFIAAASVFASVRIEKVRPIPFLLSCVAQCDLMFCLFLCVFFGGGGGSLKVRCETNISLKLLRCKSEFVRVFLKEQNAAIVGVTSAASTVRLFVCSAACRRVLTRLGWSAAGKSTLTPGKADSCCRRLHGRASGHVTSI